MDIRVDRLLTGRPVPLESAHAKELASEVNGMVDRTGIPASDLRKKLLETANETSLESCAASSPVDQLTPSDNLKTSVPDDIRIREDATNQPGGASANGASHLRNSNVIHCWPS